MNIDTRMGGLFLFFKKIVIFRLFPPTITFQTFIRFQKGKSAYFNFSAIQHVADRLLISDNRRFVD